MDIDLLFTPDGQSGLILSRNLPKKAIGVLLDLQTGMMNLEYADGDQIDFNIPVDDEFWDTLEFTTQLHVGSIKAGTIGQAYQVPLMFLDDPYRGEKLGRAKQFAKPLAAFDNFIKRCSKGQPVHRDDLGNEETMGCILGDASPAMLQFAPHLAREHALEVRPTAAPSAPGMNAPGLGGSSSSSTSRSSYRGSGQSDDQD
jgi:hypothetical protein